MNHFLATSIERFASWGKRPATPADRFSAAICAGVAGFWLGALARIGLAASASLTDIALCAALGIAAGSIVGRRFPKTSMLLFFPFTLLGTSFG